MLSSKRRFSMHHSPEQVTNGGEAALLVHIATALKAAGLPAADIGAISPYRAQVGLRGGETFADDGLTSDHCRFGKHLFDKS